MIQKVALENLRARRELEEQPHKQTIRANMTHDELKEWLTSYMIEEEEKTKALMEALRFKNWPDFVVVERPERNFSAADD